MPALHGHALAHACCHTHVPQVFIYGGRKSLSVAGIFTSSNAIEQWDVDGLVVNTVSLSGYANVLARWGELHAGRVVG